MKKDSRLRMYEVMGRLDKTFKPRLNEGFEEIETTDNVEVPNEMGGDETSSEQPVKKTPDEKLQELTAKVDEIYALLHDNGESEEIGDEIDIETDETNPENLQEWNFDKKKGEEKEEETPVEEKEENKEELDEAKPKIPVAAVAKVGK